MNRTLPRWLRAAAALALGLLPCGAGAQDLFANAYGGSGTEWAYSLQQTADGGYVLSGPSSTSSAGGYDFWIAKLDAAGALVWQRRFGGSADDIPNAMQQTQDGGYVLAGRTQSFGAGGFDAWILKLDASGAPVWQKTFGGTKNDMAYTIRPIPSGGYYVAGWTESYGSGGYDFWILKLDAAGGTVWQREYGGSGTEVCYASCLSPGGGLVVAGSTSSYGAGNNDVWVIQVDASGGRVWQKSYGGTASDIAFAVQPTADGGYAVAGRTESSGAGNADFWLLKLDASGDRQWQRTYGGSALDWAFALQQTPDGGYLVVGQTLSSGAGAEDAWLLRLDASGAPLWQRTFGGSSLDYAYCTAPAADGTLLVGGVTGSFGTGGYDAFVLKLDDACFEATACPAFRTAAGTVGSAAPSSATQSQSPKTSASGTANTTVTAATATAARSVLCAYPVLPAGGEVTLFVSGTGASTRLDWQPPAGSCGATGYGVYRGTFPVGAYDYEAVDCAVPGDYFVDSSSGENQYYLVVAHNASAEGSLGTSFDGTSYAQRPPPAAAPCRPRCLLPCP